jgi:zinc transporter ZupT
MAEMSVNWLIPIASGGFLYIAIADLIPELHKTKDAQSSIFQITAVIFGVLLMLALTFLE